MKRMNKSHILTVAAIGIGVAMTVTGCGGGTKDAPASGATAQSGQAVVVGENGTPVTVGLTYIPNVQFSPVYVAADDGIFSAAGLAASVRHHGSDEGLFTALMTGEEQVTIATGDEVLQARSAGMDIVSIGAYYHIYPVEIVVPEDSDINNVADLKGKTVGLPGEFGSNWFGLLAALDQAGISRTDLTIMPIGYTQAASLADGKVDAIVGFTNNESVQLQEMGIPVRALEDSQNLPLVGASIVSTRDWVEKNPQTATAVVDAITSGTDRVIASPQHGVEATEKWDPGLSDPSTRRAALATLQATILLWEGPDGKASGIQDLSVWENMGKLLGDLLEIDNLASEVEAAVTNDYTSR